MTGKRNVWLFWGVVLSVLFLCTNASPNSGDDEEDFKSSFIELAQMLKPDGLGSIQLGALKEEVWRKTSWGTERFDGPSRKIWDQTPSSGLHFPYLFCMVYWGFQDERLQKITLHFPPQGPFSSPGQIIRNYLLARESLVKTFGVPTQSQPVDVLVLEPGSCGCTARWTFLQGSELKLLIYRHEHFPRMYSVGIEILGGK